jgi:metallophosphoesterase (TIGR00282 family)
VNALRVLFLGDIVGRPGRRVCREHVRAWREKYNLDAVIANAENASGGNGLTVKNADELFASGIDFLTSGNHIWKQRDHSELFQKYSTVVRPANYPDGNPGRGWGVFEAAGVKVGVLNLLGQVYMDPIDSPWTAADRFLPEIAKEAKIIIVDIHAEATSERMAMGIYLDGRVSAVLGTHTHVPSADARILPGGTAYQTDLGMVGPLNSVLGVDSEAILKKFTTYLPARFEIAAGPVICSGALLTIDTESGRSLAIERFEELVD